MSKTATKPVGKGAPKTNTFSGLGDMLVGGFDQSLMSEAIPRTMYKLADIEVEPQVREEFEDEDNSLDELGESLAKGQIQPILLRKGRVKPYLLVCGGRRYLAGERKGLVELWGDYRPDMTDEEAERLQFQENIQRKNLTQIEEAKRIQRDLDALGSVEAVLEKHNKSRAWLSKILALLTLPEQAKRLVKESISADLEVINTVKTIEKADPSKAKALVDELKESRGKVNARAKAAAVKEEVKPKKEKKDTGGSVATPRDRSQEEPGQGQIFAGAKHEDEDEGDDQAPTSAAPPALRPAETLGRAYTNIFEHSSSPKVVLEVLSDDERDSVEAWLLTFYEAGKQAKDTGRAVMQGFRNGQFACDGDGAFALVAFLHGADSGAKFSLLNILAAAKP